MSPQFSNGLKVYFASDEVREKVYPQMSDGAAYGSLIFTPCQDFKELQNLRILVVDDEPDGPGGVPGRAQIELVETVDGDRQLLLDPGRLSRLPQADDQFGAFTGAQPRQHRDVHRSGDGPAVGGRPIIPRAAMENAAIVQGILRPAPAISLTLLTPIVW